MLPVYVPAESGSSGLRIGCRSLLIATAHKFFKSMSIAGVSLARFAHLRSAEGNARIFAWQQIYALYFSSSLQHQPSINKTATVKTS